MNVIPTSRFLLVARQWTLRGRNTDYMHFFNWFPKATILTSERAFKRPYALLKKIHKWARQDGYSSTSAGLELATMLMMITKRPKVVHFWFADHDYHFAWVLAKIMRIKIVGNFFFSIEEMERRIPNKQHLQRLSMLTSSGKAQMDYLKKHVPAEKIVYLPLGVDTRFYAPPIPDGDRLRRPFTLLQVGFNRRDMRTLLHVFRELRQRFQGIRLEMVGCHHVKDQFQSEEGVYFHSFVEDSELLKIYQKSTILLLPLLEGGSSQTLNEAMATGLPVVTNQLPNIEDYARESGTLFSAVADVDSMVAHCTSLLSDESLYRKTSEKVRRHALQFDFENVRAKLFDAYRSVLSIDITH